MWKQLYFTSGTAALSLQLMYLSVSDSKTILVCKVSNSSNYSFQAIYQDIPNMVLFLRTWVSSSMITNKTFLFYLVFPFAFS